MILNLVKLLVKEALARYEIERIKYLLLVLIIVLQVRLAVDKITKVTYAAKILHKKQIVKENKVKYVSSEKAILDQLRHPNVVRLFFTFQTKEDLCIH